MEQRQVGVIREVNVTYGFIESMSGSNGGGGRIAHFFHRADVVGGTKVFRQMEVGDQVEFDVVVPIPEKGARARDVVWLKPSKPASAPMEATTA